MYLYAVLLDSFSWQFIFGSLYEEVIVHMPECSILITGCSSGFGRVTALALAQSGWRVFATVRKQSDRESLMAEAKQHNACSSLMPIICDITQQEQVTALAQQIATTVPRLDALLNNAGTAFASPIELLQLDDLRLQLEINVIAQVSVTQAMLPLLKVARGTIINVSSIGGRISIPVMGAYSASKFAIEAISDALRLELAPTGVRVVLIEPGSSPTGIWQTSQQRADTALAQHRTGPYARLLTNIEKLEMRTVAMGFPPQVFADTVIKILNSRHPRARYAVNWSAGLQILLHDLLPTTLWDAILRFILRW